MPEEGQEGGYAVHGTVAKGYESVRSLFEANFKSGREANAQLCAYVGDQKVVDLWGTAINDKEYSADSLTTVFSSTKSLTAIVFASLVDQGLLDYEDKISSVWPEFAENGKGELTVSSVMRHEAGLARIKGKFSSQGLYKDGIRKNILGEYLEHQKLQYPPEGSGTTRQYHSLSRGFILQEIFRRVDPKKRTIGEYLKEEIARPLETDTYLGASESEIARRSPLAGWSKAKVVWNHIVPEVFGSKIEKTALGYSGALYYSYIVSKLKGKLPWEDDGATANKSFLELLLTWDNQDFLKGEIPSANALCSARGLAKIGAVMANGGKLWNFQIMKPATWDKMHGGKTLQVDYSSPFSGFSPVEFSRGGLAHFREVEGETDEGQKIRRYRQGYYGWYGFGGSVFMWNPDLRIGFGYVPTLMAWHDPYNLRGAKLQSEVAKCAKAQLDQNNNIV